jgi:UDP-N-acetyl-D-mannosaminuronate dehydrogenase
VEAGKEFDIPVLTDLDDASNFDAVILAVNHDIFKDEISLEKLSRITSDKPVLVDIRRHFNGNEAEKMGFYYRTL